MEIFFRGGTKDAIGGCGGCMTTGIWIEFWASILLSPFGKWTRDGESTGGDGKGFLATESAMGYGG